MHIWFTGVFALPSSAFIVLRSTEWAAYGRDQEK